MVDLLKRNHDILMEKYELSRRKAEGLEKGSVEKENLLAQIK